MSRKPSRSGADEAQAQIRAEEERARQEAEEARRREEERNARIAQAKAGVDAQFAPFNDEYFGGLRQSYLDFALPQLDRQFKDAEERLLLAIADTSGNPYGSLLNTRRQRLLDDYNAQLGLIQDTAREQEARAREMVANARQELYGQAQATADPNAAVTAARERVGALQTPPAYSPLGNLFASLLEGIATTAEAARAARPYDRSLLFDQPRAGRTGSARVVTG